MEPEGFIELSRKFSWKLTDPFSDLLNGNGAHLLCLSLGIKIETSGHCAQCNLEWIDTLDVWRHWNNGYHSTTKSLCGAVCAVVAHDDCGSTLVGLGTDHWLEVNPTEFPASH
jgi:hypothetical protein